ncbi:MAG: GNAT family N-acetyltransferase [Roseobacter sp.]|nr:GNAT family N-acetyltransferase [Roseobacter sp.]
MTEDSPLSASNNTPKKIKLRLASAISELEYLRPVSLELHGESRYADIPYSHKKRDDLFIRAINEQQHYALFIAELDDEPVGFLFCTVGEYIVGYGDLITTVYSFYVRHKYRGTLVGGKAAIRLVASVVKWSEQRKAREVMIHATSGIDVQRTDRFLRRARFGIIGGNYSLRLGRTHETPQ